ncbi:LysR family transcriptional regulator [Citromicrobium bathyomarinum]
MKLDQVRTFVEVVRANGFTAAADATGIPRSTVSLQVKALEEALGTRLLKRSTRSVSLTDDGRRLYDKASSAVETIERGLDEVRNIAGTLRGMVRMTAPADLPTAPLAGALREFRQEHPEVTVEVQMTNQTIDLFAANVDIALRMAIDPGQEEVERPLIDVEWGFFAAPSWLASNPMPARAADIRDFLGPSAALRAFLEARVLSGRRLPPAGVVADNLLLIRELIVQGYGVGLVPRGLCEDLVENGLVECVCGNERLEKTRLNMTFPTRADMIPRVRAFSNCLAKHFQHA